MKFSVRLFLLNILLVIFVEGLCTQDFGYKSTFVDTSSINTILKSPEFVILMPADSSINDLPVLKEKPKSDTIKQIVDELFRTSYMFNSVRLYYLAQIYLINIGKQKHIEPAYLLLSNNQGGFPKFGFYLQLGDTIKS